MAVVIFGWLVVDGVVGGRLFVGNLNAGHQRRFLVMVAIEPHLVSLWLVASDGFKHTKAHYFVWSFLACHLACIVLLRDYGGDIGLLAVCVTWPVWKLCRHGFVQQCQYMAIFSIDIY